MKSISAEEFLKQPREIQEVFLDNIVLEHGDLYKDTADLTVIESLDYINTTSEEGTIYHSIKGNMSDYSTIVPLLTEGQLREFIEDKTSELAKTQCKMKIEYKTKDEIEESKSNSNLSLQSQEGYFIQITSTEFIGGIMEFHDLGTDLLKAYWQVAIQVAKEEIFKGALRING